MQPPVDFLRPASDAHTRVCSKKQHFLKCLERRCEVGANVDFGHKALSVCRCAHCGEGKMFWTLIELNAGDAVQTGLSRTRTRRLASSVALCRTVSSVSRGPFDTNLFWTLFPKRLDSGLFYAGYVAHTNTRCMSSSQHAVHCTCEGVVSDAPSVTGTSNCSSSSPTPLEEIFLRNTRSASGRVLRLRVLTVRAVFDSPTSSPFQQRPKPRKEGPSE